MATSRKMNLGKTKKLKTSPVAPILSDLFIPKTAEDWAWTLGGGKAFQLGKRAVGGIAKKGAKHVNKLYRNMGR